MRGSARLDLYLIHWQQLDRDKYIDTFKAFQKLKADGRIGSIGVASFTIPTLEKLIDAVGETPSINEIELHSALQPCRTSCGPHREGHRHRGVEPTRQRHGSRRSGVRSHLRGTRCDACSVILRWHIQLGNVAIPKSVTPSRIASNFDVFGFEFSNDEVQQINALDTADGRTGPDPDKFSS